MLIECVVWICLAALLGLGMSLEGLHKPAEAAVYLQRALNVRPGDFQAGYELALALREAEQSAAARKFVNQIAPPPDPESAVTRDTEVCRRAPTSPCRLIRSGRHV